MRISSPSSLQARSAMMNAVCYLSCTVAMRWRMMILLLYRNFLALFLLFAIISQGPVQCTCKSALQVATAVVVKVCLGYVGVEM